MVTEKEIVNFYVNDKLSGREIVKKTKHSLTYIQNILKKNNVTRSLKEARNNLIKDKDYIHPFKKDLDQQQMQIIYMYISEHKSIPQIAKHFNCSLAPIFRILRENSIQIKSRSESHKGKIGYWKGKKRSEISINMLGKRFSEKHKENLRKSHLGKKPIFTGKTYVQFYGEERTKELKEKLRISHLGQKSHRKGKTFEQEFGIKKALELKQKLREKRKKYIKEHPGWRELNSKRMKEFYSKLENKEAMIKRLKEYYKEESSENKEKRIKSAKFIWSTSERKEFARERRLKQKFPFKNTLPERLIFEEMEKRNIKFIKHQTIFKFQPDAVVEDKKIAIFIDGDYWHVKPGSRYASMKLSLAQIKKIKDDKWQNEILLKNGWIVLRYWESDIKEDPKLIVDEIQNKIIFNTFL